jgi:hypothetical protein
VYRPTDFFTGPAYAWRLADQDLTQDRTEPKDIGQGLASDEFDGKEGRAVGQHSQGVIRRNARMRQLGGELRFADEADGIGPGQQDLQSAIAVQADVESGKDLAHAAAGDLAQDPVINPPAAARTSPPSL